MPYRWAMAMQQYSCMAPLLLCGQRAVQGRESLTDLHQVKGLLISGVTAILKISVGYITPATSQSCWTLNIQFDSFWASPSYFSGFSNLIFEPVNVPGPIAAGSAGGAGGAVYAACHRFTTSSIRSLTFCGTASDTCVT